MKQKNEIDDRLNVKSIIFQILIAFVFAALNLLLREFCGNVLNIPLFMDMVFIYAASFFGLLSGLLCSVFHTLLEYFFITHFTNHFPYIICMFTGVIIVRVCMKKINGHLLLNLLLISLLSAILISIEGGIIYTILFSELNFAEFVPTVYLTAQLIMSNVPIIFSAILARIPINIADKLIAVFAGYGIYAGIKKIRDKVLTAREKQNINA